MPIFGPQNAQCHVFTRKEGLLSAIAHDLEIDVTDFSIEVDVDSIRMQCNPNSLRVIHAIKDGQPLDALSAKDKQEIQGNIVEDVLEASKYSEISFVSSGVIRTPDGAQVTGMLSLHGVNKSIDVDVHTEGSAYLAEISLYQPDFGIKPYSAMLGTLKVRPDLVVRVTVPTW